MLIASFYCKKLIEKPQLVVNEDEAFITLWYCESIQKASGVQC